VTLNARSAYWETKRAPSESGGGATLGGGGGGKNKPPKCVDDVFSATLAFMSHPDGSGPAIYPSDGLENLLIGTFTHGNIAGGVENASGDPLPVSIDLLGDHHYLDHDGHSTNDITVDPFAPLG